MADPTISASNAAASTTGADRADNSACQISKAAVEEMSKGTASPSDSKQSQEMDFAKIKDVLEKMKACNAEIMQRAQDMPSKIRNIRAN